MWLPATPAAGLLSGLLFALAFPPRGLVLLLPLALVPWVLALWSEEHPGRAAISGLLFGLAFWCSSIPWIVFVVTRFGGQSPVMGLLSLAILALFLSQWSVLVAWATVLGAPPRSPWRFALFPLLWMAAEHVRSYAYGGFPWNLTGWALYRHPVWLQSAAVWGVFGVGLLVAACASLLAASVARRRAGPTAVAALIVAATGIAGAIRIGRSEASGHSLETALVQPNISQEERLDAAREAENYLRLFDSIREAAAGRPDLIVLPESSFSVYWERSARLQRDLTEASRGCGCPILFNDVTFEPDGTYSNAARLLTPAGLASATYRKVHLVPFGEYVPLPKLFFFVRQISTEIGEFAASDSPVVIRSGPLALGVGVCYEIIYPSLAREQVSRGANLLATISNDSWYGRAGAQQQHFGGALVRAVENGRYLVRAAITGITGAVDDRGRILGELPPDEPGILRAAVRLRSEETAWTRWGWTLPLVADAAGAGVLIFGLLRRARGRRRGARGVPR